MDAEAQVGQERADAAAWLAQSRAWFEQLLESKAIDDTTPPSLATAMRHALTGGKRLRPALVRMSCRWLGGSDAAAEHAALAIEHVHAYSLVHDDLPCMDDDAWRHGLPSCHVLFGEALAVLVGDALLTKAFAWLAHEPAERCAASVAILARAAGDNGMVGGQVLDLTLPERSSVDDVARMHALKTARLLAASCELGGVAAGANERQRGLLTTYGTELGLCFQALDDVLDVTADGAALGKTPGKDAKLGKATMVTAVGLEGARTRATEHAERARVAALGLGGPWAPLALALVELLLDRRS